MLRILRLLRLTKMSGRLEDEVFYAATKLCMSLVCTLVIAAAVFYELEVTVSTCDLRGGGGGHGGRGVGGGGG